ncbi:hypothetical protein Tco_1008690 [Tanacetum coccineum]
MSTQQDIYVVSSENRPPMLNKDNYVPWYSRLLCYEVPVAETFHEQTDDELIEKEIKQMEADDQAIQTILLGLPKDIYACWIANHNENHNGNGNVVATRAEGNGNANNGNHVLCYDCRGMGRLARNYTVRPRRRDAAYLQTHLMIAQKKKQGTTNIEEFDLMAFARDL